MLYNLAAVLNVVCVRCRSAIDTAKGQQAREESVPHSKSLQLGLDERSEKERRKIERAESINDTLQAQIACVAWRSP